MSLRTFVMTADANKAESLLCMDKAREAIKAGDAKLAERMLHKAKKLNPEQDISFLLSKALGMGKNGPRDASSSFRRTASEQQTSSGYAHDDHYEEPTLRSRKHKHEEGSSSSANLTSTANGRPRSRSAPRSASAAQLGVDYTEEEMKLVERIRHCRDYYEILSVPKNATDIQIKKGYQKMALQLHPDKCRVPNATEAFKALANAYAVLSSKEKREQYDMYGAEGPQRRQTQRGDYFEYDYGRGFESDFTAEEIFNMFFGGQFPSESVGRRRQQQHHFHARQETPREESAYAPFLQLVPLLAILVLGLLAQFMVGDPAFSLHHTNKYTERRETTELKVPYFVKKDFETTYRGKIRLVENQVEDEYISQLRMHCYKEQNQKETMYYRARVYQDVELLRRAERLATPNCDRLKEIYNH